MNREQELHAYAQSIHRLAHQYGSCDCDQAPPDPTPERLALRRSLGLKAAARAKADGLDLGPLTDDQVIELGAAELEAVKAKAMQRLRAINAANEREARAMDAPVPARPSRGSRTPERSRSGSGAVDDLGQVDLHTVRQQKDPDRITVYDRNDDNEEWRSFR